MIFLQLQFLLGEKELTVACFHPLLTFNGHIVVFPSPS